MAMPLGAAKVGSNSVHGRFHDGSRRGDVLAEADREEVHGVGSKVDVGEGGRSITLS
ncbi:N-acetyltransferase [Sesbania bispinosa]|nr:N-acetyltransferase [Sesbania bispinosa]